MKPAGLALAWVGYTLAYFGFCSLRGPGVGLLDLVIPGRTVVIPGNSPTFGQGPVGKIDPATGAVTPNFGQGAPYRLVPVPGQPGQYSQEPITNPNALNGSVA